MTGGTDATVEGSTISLPQGGGAISGMGETFTPDPFTGTGKVVVPIALPPGRRGVRPGLQLSYDTGHANGPFGLGWQLSLPGVSRGTSRGVPRYVDGEDTFVLSGAEDLVRVGGADPGRVRYRPRTEGPFARIEHVRTEAGDDYWEVRSRDGLLTRYGSRRPSGADATWRDPAALADSDAPRRIFAWRITESEDPLGNLVRYEYTRDNGQERGHRWDQPRLARIAYCDYGDRSAPSFLVTVDFDYEPRPDSFSDRRAGFEVRTAQRCRAIRITTHAADGVDRVVRECRLGYAQATLNGVSLLVSLQVVGIDGARTEAFAPLTFEYAPFDLGGRRLTPLSGDALPSIALNDPTLALVDLGGGGLLDLVELGPVTRRYWSNAGAGRFERPRPLGDAPPFSLADPGVELIDADGDGRPDLLVGGTGYFPMVFGGRWSRRSFRAYARAPAASPGDASVRLVDLDGDGITDVLQSGTRLQGYFNDPDPRRAWARSAATDGYGPDIDLADPRVRLADMTGDGLQDLVLLRSGNVCYWPSLGHGRWGPMVTMRNSPHLPRDVDLARVLLGDVDGDGAADLVFADAGRLLMWGNHSGDAWSEQPLTIPGTPLGPGDSAVRLSDLHGTGMAGVLFGGPAARPRMLFLDITGGVKPYLLAGMDNHRGARTRITYRSSTVDYLRDRAVPATRWRTTLPFPVHVVARIEVTDACSGGRLITELRYHHGYWDGVEREFRGFAMVEQLDAETVHELDAPPVLIKTWFHPGPVAAQEVGDWTELDLRHEYWDGDGSLLERPPEVAAFLAGLARADRRAALRAFRGQVLRTERYGLDGTPRAARPYTVTEAVLGVRAEEAGVYFGFAAGSRVTQWERGSEPLTRFTFPAQPDAYGCPTGRLEVAVPRGRDPTRAGAAGEPYLAAYAETTYARRDDARYIVDRAARTRTFEVRNDGSPAVAALRAAVRAGSAELRVTGDTRTYYDGEAYIGLGLGHVGEHGLPVRTETLAFTDAFLAELGPRPPYLDPTSAQWPAEYPSEFRAAMPPLAGYVYADGGYYVTSACRRFDGRGLVVGTRDQFGAESRIVYDEHDLLPVRTRDPVGLAMTASYDPRLLLARRVTDANGNTTRVTFSPTGLTTAQSVHGKAGDGDATEPSARFEHDLLAFAERGQPVSVRTVRRVRHDTDLPRDDATVVSVTYADGFGRVLQTRTLAEDAPDRVTVSGWQVYDNKGRVVESYEPFFSTGWDFAAPGEAELGQRVTTTYDPLGRVQSVVQPDGSERRVVIGVPADLTQPDAFTATPWETYTYDENDNAGRTHGTAADGYRAHWNTPAGAEVDALGRTVRGVSRNGSDPDAWFVTRTTFDLQGNLVAITDALGRLAFRYHVDLAGRRWRMDSIDAGRRDSVPNAAGDAVEGRDARGALRLAAFDVLHRPARVWARDDAGDTVTLRRRVEYGDGGRPDQPAAERAAARERNVLGRPVRQFDEAGLLTVEAVDFKGNVLESARRMLADTPILETFAQAAAHAWQVQPFRVDWTTDAGALLEPVAYVTTTAFDALDRITRHVLPSDVEGRRRALRPVYNRAGALAEMRLDDLVVVRRVAYDAAGRRTLIEYGNGVVTRLEYDPRTFRLTRLRSARNGKLLQDQRYQYDAAGNMLAIRDRAPGCGLPHAPDALDREFTYDPVYRLLSATGREWDAPIGGPPWADLPRGSDPSRTRPYTETYSYDAMGALLALRHASADGFTRTFANDASSNRLERVTVAGAPYDYVHDAAGNLIAETTSRRFGFDHVGRLATFATQTPGSEPSLHVHYLYDLTGQRLKKLVRRQGGAVEVTHYVGGVFEHHRWAGGENDHIHVMDNRRRVALVRVGPAQPGDTSPATQIQLADHVGSPVVVVDGAGAVVNREEFSPYGETTFGSFARKRYRFAGREREEESGLGHHGARYLHLGLGRWIACDPDGAQAQQNLYRFAADSPLRYEDPTGTQDRQLEGIGDFLQDLADEFLEPALRRLPNESASAFGTRLHSDLQAITESAALNAPRRVRAERILTEVIIDPSGNIWAFGGKPGGAPTGSVTVDIAILEPGLTNEMELRGRKAKDVLAAGIDYKTGDARLAQHQQEFFDKIKKPLHKLAADGHLSDDLLQRSVMRKPAAPSRECPSRRRSQGGFIEPGLMRGMGEYGAALLVQTLVEGELPSAQDTVRIVVETRFPVLGIAEASNHGETVIPILCYFGPQVCGTIAAAGVSVIIVGKSAEAFGEKSEEVFQDSVRGISRIYGGF